MSLQIHDFTDFTLPPLVRESEDEHNYVFGQCFDCGKERTSDGWCKGCETNAFIENFGNWTSENINIDKFIRSSQLNANGSVDYLEYINFKQFDLIENTNKGGAFSTIYSAVWMEGPRWIWDEMADQWTRNGPIRVALKRLNNSQCISEGYLNQLYKYQRCLHGGSVADLFGITKDHTSNYMFVMKFYENGDLHSYLDETQGMLCWRDIIDMLWEIAGGIEYIHEKGLIHGNLHGGNILIEHEPDSINTRISDVGLNGPANKIDSNDIYGVLPYVAPEILQGKPLTKAADIFSFGIIMWTLSAGIRPWSNISHDFKLANEICFGLRPEIIDGTPNVYIQLMTQCLHSDPFRRPTAFELNELLGSWITAICDDPDQSELSVQFDLAEEKKFSNLENNSFHRERIHPEAFYTSRLLYFPELHNNDELL